MQDVRVIYQKSGRAKYISHLDVNRMMLRALKRSGLPVWHTQGYNPRPFISFALPLSLGFTSTYEVMDFRLSDDAYDLDAVLPKLQAVMPESFRILEVTKPAHKPRDLCYASFALHLVCDRENVQRLCAMLEQTELFVQKQTKKKQIKQIDLKPHIKEWQFEPETGGGVLKLILPAGNALNINPMLLLEKAENEGISLEAESVVRTGIYLKNMQLFR